MSNLKFYDFNVNNIKIIIFNSPNDNTIEQLNYAIHKYSIDIIFRLCEPLYNKNLVNCNIEDVELFDGSYPSNNFIVNIIKKIENSRVIGIHCIAGLGRSPTLCAILLLYYSNNNYNDIVNIIRLKIKGAINKTQLEGLSKFNKKSIDKILYRNKCIIF